MSRNAGALQNEFPSWSGGNYKKVGRNKTAQAVAQDGCFRHRISRKRLCRFRSIRLIPTYKATKPLGVTRTINNIKQGLKVGIPKRSLGTRNNCGQSRQMGFLRQSILSCYGLLVLPAELNFMEDNATNIYLRFCSFFLGFLLPL